MGACGCRAPEDRPPLLRLLVYNTFPVPDLTSEDKAALTNAANRVLGTREMFSEQTLAELYDPNKMPPDLREAHAALDKLVDDLYDSSGFDSDEERLELLFKLYAELTSAPEKPDRLATAGTIQPPG